jgi:hypothetical protein
MTQDAITRYQAFLDHMGEALIACDADSFLRHVFLPHVIVTETATIHIGDTDKALRHFKGFSGALRSQGADAYTRIASHAWFDGDNILKGRHETFITSRGKLLVPKFGNEITLERRDGIWGSVRTVHQAHYVSWPDLLPRGGASS